MVSSLYHRLFVRYSRRAHTAEGVAADEIIRTEFDNGGCDHIEKFLNTGILLRRRVGFQLFCHWAYFLPFHLVSLKKPPHYCSGGINTISFAVDKSAKKG